MSLLAKLLSEELITQFGATEGSAAAVAYERIVEQIRDELGSGQGGSIQDDEFRLSYTPHITNGSDTDHSSLGVIHLDWIEGSNSDGKVRVIRCEAPDLSGERGSQLTFMVGATDNEWLLGFLMRYG